MHRIDSSNARPDQNGTGKAGFNDNQDLPGHEATYGTPDWHNTVQEEFANAVEGFGQIIGDKSNNAQLFTILFALAGRIQLLENKVHEDVRIGSVFITTVNFTDSDSVRAHKGYGRWQRLGDGHALVARARSGNLNAPVWMFDLGGTGGEYSHQQTAEEMFPHRHSNAPYDKFGSIAAETTKGTPSGFDSNEIWSEYGVGWMNSENWNQATENKVGGGQPFNIIQPSLVVDVWLRLEDEPSELIPTYELSVNRTEAQTGETVIFTLQTTHLDIGRQVAWNIIGIDGSAILPASLSGSFVINAAGRATYALKAINAGEFIFSLTNVANTFVNISIDADEGQPSPYDKYPVAEWCYQFGSQYYELRDDTTIDNPEVRVADYHRKQTALMNTEVFACIYVVKTAGATVTENTYQIPVITDQKGLVVTQLVNNIGDTALETGEVLSLYVGYFATHQPTIQTPIQPAGTLGGIVHEFHFK